MRNLFNRRYFLGLGLAFLLAFILAPQAMADELEDAKAAGIVGETPDGYLQAREASAKTLVERVNAQRKKYYEEIAQKNGVSADTVGKLTAQEIYQKAKKGTYLLVDGQWVKK